MRWEGNGKRIGGKEEFEGELLEKKRGGSRRRIEGGEGREGMKESCEEDKKEEMGRG